MNAHNQGLADVAELLSELSAESQLLTLRLATPVLDPAPATLSLITPQGSPYDGLVAALPNGATCCMRYSKDEQQWFVDATRPNGEKMSTDCGPHVAVATLAWLNTLLGLSVE